MFVIGYINLHAYFVENWLYPARKRNALRIALMGLIILTIFKCT